MYVTMICFLSFTVASVFAAPTDILTPGWGCAERGGSTVTPLIPGGKQKAVESTDVLGCGSGVHSSQGHANAGEKRCKRSVNAVNI